MQALYDLATALGVHVEHTDLTPLNLDGAYHHPTRTIHLQHGMLYRLHRSVLAHELGHATHQDQPTIFRHVNARQERLADEYAAHLLINPDEYRQAEERYGTNTEAIAQELHVMDYIIEAYGRTLHRIGDTIYINPRMGTGQHQAKLETA